MHLEILVSMPVLQHFGSLGPKVTYLMASDVYHRYNALINGGAARRIKTRQVGSQHGALLAMPQLVAIV